MRRHTAKENLISAALGISIGSALAVTSLHFQKIQRAKCANEMYAVQMEQERQYEADRAEALREEAIAESEQIAEENYQAELELLACLVYAEAGNQDLMGKRLVADTVLNRVDSPDFPDTISGVIYQKNQFTPVSNGALDRAFTDVTPDCYEAVSMELEERADWNVLYFSSDGFQPYGTPAFKYQDHYFNYE